MKTKSMVVAYVSLLWKLIATEFPEIIFSLAPKAIKL